MLDGFRKIRSETHSNLNTNDWWVFRHPNFVRGDEAALSLIKKSAHFVEALPKDDVSGLKAEVSNLRENVSSLSSRIAQLDNVVAYLMNTIQNQSVNAAPVAALSFLPGSTVSGSTSPSSGSLTAANMFEYHDDKKRKLKPDNSEFSAVTTQSQAFEHSNYFNSFPIDHSFPQVTGSSHLLPIQNVKYDTSSYAPLGDANIYRNASSMAQTYYDEDEDVIHSDSNDDIDFDALLEVTADDNDYFAETTPLVLADAPEAFKFDDITSHLSSRSSVKTLESNEVFTLLANNSSTAEKGAVDVNRIRDIINQLPSLELQNRFVDQLALSVGQHCVSDVIGKKMEHCNVVGVSSELIQSLNKELDWHSKDHGDAILRASCSQSNAAGSGVSEGRAASFNVDMIGNNSTKTDNQSNSTSEMAMNACGGGGGAMKGATSLEQNCPLVALGALLASVRLSSSEATESAAQVFSKSCANLKERMASFTKMELLPSLSGDTAGSRINM